MGKTVQEILAEKAAAAAAENASREEAAALLNKDGTVNADLAAQPGFVKQSDAAIQAMGTNRQPVIIGNSADPAGTTATVNLPAAVAEAAGREYDEQANWTGTQGPQAVGMQGSVEPGTRTGMGLNAFVRQGIGQTTYFDPTEDDLKSTPEGTFIAGTLKQYFGPNGDKIVPQDGVFYPESEEVEADLRAIAKRKTGELFEGTGARG